MFKIKNFKVEFKHLLIAVSAIGMAAGFIVSLCSKKKTAAFAAFLASFAGLIAGLGMESGLVPEPKACKRLEIELDAEEEGEDSEDDEIVIDESSDDGDEEPEV